MKILVATAQTQGHRANDFHWCPEDEPVGLAPLCGCTSLESRCGCPRTFLGLTSHHSTTTTKVAEVEMTPDEYVALILKWKNERYKDWDLSPEELTEEAAAEADELIKGLAEWPVGMIVERQFNELVERDCSGCPEHGAPGAAARESASTSSTG